ncbi:MAG: gamma carbonic anhydrase family protein, partial [Gammaproteobacteria bacterium]
GAIVLDGAVIGRGCVVAAGALVPPGRVIPDGVVVMGSPAQLARELKEEDRVRILRGAEVYRRRSALYRTALKPFVPGS